jgi:hypothetical protein
LRSPRCVFICGCAHSGTSLVANILAAHPKVYIPLTETGIFLAPATKARWKFYHLLAKALCRNKLLVEKTPLHLRKLKKIRKIAKGCVFLIPVRDGRDVAASLTHKHGDVARAVDNWIKDTGIIAEARSSPDVLVYRHEDLIEQPGATLAEICSFIGLPFTPTLLDYHERPRLWFGEQNIRRGSGRAGIEHTALRNWQINQPIFDSRGRWRNELPEPAVRELEEGRGRSLMQAFGYVKDAAPKAARNALLAEGTRIESSNPSLSPSQKSQ